jgi:hypothetical protein
MLLSAFDYDSSGKLLESGTYNGSWNIMPPNSVGEAIAIELMKYHVKNLSSITPRN